MLHRRHVTQSVHTQDKTHYGLEQKLHRSYAVSEHKYAFSKYRPLPHILQYQRVLAPTMT